jgi:hypothetical protein
MFVVLIEPNSVLNYRLLEVTSPVSCGLLCYQMERWGVAAPYQGD